MLCSRLRVGIPFVALSGIVVVDVTMTEEGEGVRVEVKRWNLIVWARDIQTSKWKARPNNNPSFWERKERREEHMHDVALH